jgi:hypothetical protein
MIMIGVWLRAGAVLGAAMLLGGCVAAGLTLAGAGAGIAGGVGAEHTLSGIVYKTFPEPLDNLRTATVDALARMDMEIVDDKPTPEGWFMQASAARRTIDIEFEKLTENATRVRVVANKGDIFFKDAATATAIVAEAQDVLDSRKTSPVVARQSARVSSKKAR